MKHFIAGSIAFLTSIISVESHAAVESEKSSPVQESDKKMLEPTERELKKTHAQLKDLQQQITAIPRTSTEPGLGPQLVAAKTAYAHATEAFKTKDWLTVVQESSKFLSLSQKPESDSWLSAQYMIGRAYEELGQTQKAVRAYRRYLATFTTEPSKDLTNLTETFERLVRIATKSSGMNQVELSKFLSSISAMQYPADVAAELHYLAAVAGSNMGKKSLAIDWLADVDSKAKNSETRARAKYFRALIAISRKDWSTATDQLEAVLQMGDITKKSKDNARISLARVFLKQKKPELSLSSYSQIEESSEAYRDASFEKTFLLVRMGREDDARKSARQWLDKFSEHPDAKQLSNILSWLDLKAGDLGAAKAGIDATASKLNESRKSLLNDFQSPTLRHEDAIRLSNLTKGLVDPAPELEEILAMFEQIAQMKQRISEIDGSEKAIIYAIAKGDLRQFKPSLSNRIDQYDLIADQVLAAGSKIMFIERQRLQSVLSDLDKQKLAASEKRRDALFSKRSQISRQMRRWATWVEPAEQMVKLADEWQKLGALQADFNSKVLLLSAQGPTANSSDTKEFQEKINFLKQEMMNALVQIRKIQASSLVEQSSINDVIYIIQQYATALHEEAQIIASYEPQTGKMLDALDDEDSRNLWALWHDLIGELHANIKNLKVQAGQDLANVFETLEKLDKKRIELDRDIEHLKTILETYGGESLATIITHYDNALSQRLARQYKWAGDLEYLNYVKAKNDQDALTKKQNLEAQILNDNLQEIEQGGASQWPR